MKAKNLIIIFVSTATISCYALSWILRHTTKMVFVKDSDIESNYRIHVPNSNTKAFKTRRNEPNHIEVDWGETHIYLNGLCRTKMHEDSLNLVVMGELFKGKSYPVVIDSGFSQHVAVTDTVVADANLEIQPVDGLGNNAGGFCFIPQLKIGNLSITYPPCVYWLGNYEKHLLGRPIWKQKKIFFGLNLLRKFDHITIDYVSKEVEFSGNDSFEPYDKNEWYQYPFELKMDSSQGAKLIVEISIAGQLPRIRLDTGAGPGLILTEKFWSQMSSTLQAVSEEKSKLAAPYGYLSCKKIKVKELSVGEMSIRNANIYVIPNDNPMGEDDYTLGMDFFKSTIMVLDFEKNLVWIKK